MKSLAKVILVLGVILFLVGIRNLLLPAEPVEENTTLDKANTFPYSTELGGIHYTMSLKEVIEKFGEKYKGFYEVVVSDEVPIRCWFIAYNDPTGKASILINTGGEDRSSATSVSSITLSVKPIPGAPPKAKESFLNQGTARGVKLGTTMEEVKRLYPELYEPWYWSYVDEESGFQVIFWFYDKKVVKICTGYWP